ncbi:MAG: hypothetical protein AAF590_08750 [Pseudomonadota bacterium]
MNVLTRHSVRFLNAIIVHAIILGAVLLTLGALHPVTAQTRIEVPRAWCAFDGESVWRERRVPINELARLSVDLTCRGGVPMSVRVKAETQCARTLCSWGFAEFAEVEGSTLQAIFITFSATRRMTAELSGQTVSITVENDYNQAGRAGDTMRARLTLR